MSKLYQVVYADTGAANTMVTADYMVHRNGVVEFRVHATDEDREGKQLTRLGDPIVGIVPEDLIRCVTQELDYDASEKPGAEMSTGGTFRRMGEDMGGPQ